MYGLSNGEQQMCFAEAGVAVDKQGIIGLAGVLGDGDGGCMGKFI